MQFPKRESDILDLAQEMSNGLANNVATYPSPPVVPIALSGAISVALSARNTVLALQAEMEIALNAKDGAMGSLEGLMKQDLRYAENTVHFDDGKLKLIGWGGRHEGGTLQPPGQVQELAAPREGEGWILLQWNAPMTGGVVASYQIERRERPEGAWGTVGLAMETEFKLLNQKRGKEWEYRIIAVNKAGEGSPSNTVMAVL